MTHEPGSCTGYFITATDTGVGKTWCTLALMQWFQLQGLKVAGMKPVSSGCREVDGQLLNEDAMLIRQQATGDPDYGLVNPYAFVPGIAPHIAAEKAGVTIDLATLIERYTVLAEGNERIIVEGVGGWRVPLSPTQTLADLVKALDLQVILVVGLRLGCINHALLTAEAIRADGLSLAGWVANHCLTDYAEEDATLSTLAGKIMAPLLGVLPWLPDRDVTALAAGFDPAAFTGNTIKRFYRS